jgi:hypothetical protein
MNAIQMVRAGSREKKERDTDKHRDMDPQIESRSDSRLTTVKQSTVKWLQPESSNIK